MKYKKRARVISGTCYLSIPKALADYMDLKPGTEFNIEDIEEDGKTILKIWREEDDKCTESTDQ